MRAAQDPPADIGKSSGDATEAARAVARAAIGAYLRGCPLTAEASCTPCLRGDHGLPLARGEDINSRDRYQRALQLTRAVAWCSIKPAVDRARGDIGCPATIPHQTALPRRRRLCFSRRQCRR